MDTKYPWLKGPVVKFGIKFRSQMTLDFVETTFGVFLLSALIVLPCSYLWKYGAFLFHMPAAYHLHIFKKAGRYTRWGRRARWSYGKECLYWNGGFFLLYQILILLLILH